MAKPSLMIPIFTVTDYILLSPVDALEWRDRYREMYRGLPPTTSLLTRNLVSDMESRCAAIAGGLETLARDVREYTKIDADCDGYDYEVADHLDFLKRVYHAAERRRAVAESRGFEVQR